MTVDELIESLQAISDEGYGESEVRMATQPNYPLATNLKGVVLDKGEEEECEVCDGVGCDECPEDGDGPGVDRLVWLVEGSSCADSPYAPRHLWDLV